MSNSELDRTERKLSHLVDELHKFWQLRGDLQDPDFAGCSRPQCECGWRGEYDGLGLASDRSIWVEHVEEERGYVLLRIQEECAQGTFEFIGSKYVKGVLESRFFNTYRTRNSS